MNALIDQQAAKCAQAKESEWQGLRESIIQTSIEAFELAHIDALVCSKAWSF